MNCAICNRTLRDAERLERHLWRIHNKGEWGQTNSDLAQKDVIAKLRKMGRQLDAIADRADGWPNVPNERLVELAKEVLLAADRLKSAFTGSMDDEIQRLIDGEDDD